MILDANGIAEAFKKRVSDSFVKEISPKIGRMFDQNLVESERLILEDDAKDSKSASTKKKTKDSKKDEIDEKIDGPAEETAEHLDEMELGSEGVEELGLDKDDSTETGVIGDWTEDQLESFIRKIVQEDSDVGAESKTLDLDEPEKDLENEPEVFESDESDEKADLEKRINEGIQRLRYKLKRKKEVHKKALMEEVVERKRLSRLNEARCTKALRDAKNRNILTERKQITTSISKRVSNFIRQNNLNRTQVELVKNSTDGVTSMNKINTLLEGFKRTFKPKTAVRTGGFASGTTRVMSPRNTINENISKADPQLLKDIHRVQVLAGIISED